jgi:hypothetical protein
MAGDQVREVGPHDIREEGGRLYHRDGGAWREVDFESYFPMTRYQEVSERTEEWSLEEGETLQGLFDRAVTRYGMRKSAWFFAEVVNGETERCLDSIRSGKLESGDVLLQDGDHVSFVESVAA